MRRKSTSAEPWTGFQFLNFSHPSEAKDQRTRRAVRSHVTRKQHQKEGRGPAAAAAVIALANRRSYSMPQLYGLPQQYLSLLEEESPVSTMPPRMPVVVKTESPNFSFAMLDGSSSEASSISPISSASPSTPRSPALLVGELDPMQIYPPAWHPYISIAFDTYIFSFAHDILNAKDSTTIELVRTHWIPFVLTDMALLHATLLVAATLFGSHPGPRTHSIDLLQLKLMAICSINEALADPSRSGSDQIIGAVTAMAQYEAFWGDDDTEAYRSHMQGALHLVRNRGGLGFLGADGLLQSFLLSVDFQGSIATGVGRFFSSVDSYPQPTMQPSRR